MYLKKSFLAISLLLLSLQAHPQSDAPKTLNIFNLGHFQPELYAEFRVGSRIDRVDQVFAGRYLGMRILPFLHGGIYFEKVYLNQNEVNPPGRTSIIRNGWFAGVSKELIKDLEININMIVFTHPYYTPGNKNLLPKLIFECQSGFLYRLNNRTKLSLFHAFSIGTPRPYHNLALGIRSGFTTEQVLKNDQKKRFGLILNRMGGELKDSNRAQYSQSNTYKSDRLNLMNDLAQPELGINNSFGFVYLDKKQNAFSISYGKNQFILRPGTSYFFNEENSFVTASNHQFTLLAEFNLVQGYKNYHVPLYPILRIGSVFERMKNSGVLHGLAYEFKTDYAYREELKHDGTSYKNTLAMGLAFNHAGFYLSTSLQFFEFQYINHQLHQQVESYSRLSNSKQPFAMDKKVDIFTNKTNYSHSFRPTVQLSSAILLSR
jgi:hypothetical protein